VHGTAYEAIHIFNTNILHHPLPLLQTYKTYNFICYFIQVWNLVSHINGRTQAEGVSEHGAEEDILEKQEGCNESVQKISFCTGGMKNTAYKVLV